MNRIKPERPFVVVSVLRLLSRVVISIPPLQDLMGVVHYESYTSYLLYYPCQAINSSRFPLSTILNAHFVPYWVASSQ